MTAQNLLCPDVLPSGQPPLGQASAWIECPDCGLCQPKPPAQRHYCSRCRSSFGHGRLLHKSPLPLAISIGIVLFILYCFPIVSIHLEGQNQSAGVGASISAFVSHGFTLVGLFLFGIAVMAPVGEILSLVYFLLRLPRRPPYAGYILRISERLRVWSMLDVLLLGTLIAVSKLRDHADVFIDYGFWALVIFVMGLAALDASFDRKLLWDRIRPDPELEKKPTVERWICCRFCGLFQEKKIVTQDYKRRFGRCHEQKCLRCGDALHRRKPASLPRTWALVITGFILYIPANIYPVLTVIWFGQGSPQTILGGIRELIQHGDWPLGIIVFAASIVVPLLKLLGLTWLLLSVHSGSCKWIVSRTRLYRIITYVGRWSTVDLFAAAVLTALVTFQRVATVEPGWGAFAFAAVVLVTMLAVETFDCRLIWDRAERKHGSR